MACRTRVGERFLVHRHRQAKDRRRLAVQHRESRGRQRVVLPAGQTLGRIVDDAALDERH
jgi:transcriptional regulator GlxA family with amidase domain